MNPELNRILLVDEHPVIVAGLAALVGNEPDWALLGGVACLDDAIRVLDRGGAELVILEPGIRGMDGLGCIAPLAARARVLCFSSLSEPVMAERSLREGARGFLAKTRPPEEILEAIRTVLGGGVALSEEVRRRVIGRVAGLAPEFAGPGLGSLNNRELQVVHLMGAHRNSRQIAAHMRVSEKTVATHRQRIREKLALRSSNDLVRVASRWVECDVLS